MHDVETETSNSIVIPEKQHIEQILEFTKFLTDKDKLLVHCNMGVSRSTAISCGILIQHGMTFEDAYNYVKTIRNVARPNRKIIEYIDDIFALNGKFLNFINEKRNPSNVIPLNEIAKYYSNKK